MSSNGKFVKDVGIVGIAHILTTAGGIVLLPLITKTFGAEAYGIWAQIFKTLFFLMPLALFDLTDAIVRFLPAAETPEEKREHVWSTAAFALAMAFLISSSLFIFQHTIAQFLMIPAIYVVLLAIFLIFEVSIRLFLSVLQGLQEMQKFSFFTVAAVGGEIVLAFGAVALGYGLFGAILAFLLARFLVSCAMLTFILKKIGISSPHFSHMKRYFKFSVPTLASALSYQGINLSNQNLIAHFLGITFVGYYAPAYSFAALLSITYLPTSTVLPPLLAKLFAQRKIEEIQFFLSRTLSYLLFLLIPAVAGLSALSSQILEIFSTKEIAIHSSILLSLLALSFIFYGMYTVFVQILGLFLKTHYVAAIWIFAALVNFLLNFFLIPIFGILGSAIGTFIAFFLAALLTIVISRKFLAFHLHWSNIAKSIILSLLMFIGIVFIHPTHIFAILFTIIISIISYILCMLAFKGITIPELKLLKSLFLSKFQRKGDSLE